MRQGYGGAVATHLHHRLALVVGLAILLSTPAAAQSPATSVGRGLLNAPTGLAFAPDGSIVVADTGYQRVLRVSTAGAYLGQLSREFSQPVDVAVDGAGNVYVVDKGLDEVLKLTAEGDVVWRSPVPEPDAGAVAVGPGAVYVLAGGVVRRYRPDDGAAAGQWTPPGEAPSIDLAIDGSERLYLTPPHRVNIVSPDGAPLGGFDLGSAGFAPYLTVDRPGGRIFATPDGRDVLELDPAGGRLASMGPGEWAPPGAQVAVRSLALSPDAGLLAFTGSIDGADQITVIDFAQPVAAVSGPGRPVVVGESARVDASASRVPFGSITRYEWDLDGNGTFETDTGGAATVDRRFPEAGAAGVAVRVTAPSGRTATSRTFVDVRPAPPRGRVGIAINDGARFTNSPEVTLRVVWPALANRLRVANNAGFRGLRNLPLAPEVSWTLSPSGPRARTVYIRFDDATEVYRDTIVLDRTRPTIRSARASRRRSLYVIRLSARDGVSGVSTVQVTNDRSKPGPRRRYARRLRHRSRGSRLYVRVRDRAGNLSRWKRVRVGR